MLYYIIDGNNLIGKIKSLMNIQRKNKQLSREKLVFMLDKFFAGRKNKVTLHFDGYVNSPINSSKMKIVYSENLSADEKIKNQIEMMKNKKNTTVITSDSNLAEFSKVCYCKVISSEDFSKMIEKQNQSDDETSRIEQISNDEFIQLFSSK